MYDRVYDINLHVTLYVTVALMSALVVRLRPRNVMLELHSCIGLIDKGWHPSVRNDYTKKAPASHSELIVNVVYQPATTVSYPRVIGVPEPQGHEMSATARIDGWDVIDTDKSSTIKVRY